MEAVSQLKENHLLQRSLYSDQKKPIFTVTNRDSFEAAREIMKSEIWNSQTPTGKVLVLNFANATHPGGGVRYGDVAQEEDLCRRSTLLVSLEGDQARLIPPLINTISIVLRSNFRMKNKLPDGDWLGCLFRYETASHISAVSSP